MRRSVATVSLSGTLPQKLEAIAAARFDGLELFEPDFTHFSGSAAELAARCADLGLSIELFQPFRDFEGMPEAAFARSLERAERKFDLMQALGCPLMLVCSNVSPLAVGDPALAAAQLHTLAERAARRNLRIGFEALAWGRHVNRWSQAWEIVRRADHPHLGLVLDSFHTLSLDDDVAGLRDVPGGRIFFLQMADAPRMSMSVIDWARHHRNFPGQGQLDVVPFFEQVLRTGYGGPLSLEIFNDVFRESPNRRIAVDAMRSLLWLESEARRRLQDAGDDAAARALQRQALFAPPPTPRFEGIEFVEFAVDDAAAASLGSLLQAMGFARAGRHRSKPVTLYRQGGIHLVVNRLGHAAARERFEAYGPSVCALALRTADADAALQRATALQSARFDPPRGTGEQALPSIVAPGRTILHFVPDSLGPDGLYESDFEPEEDPDARDCGLRTHRPRGARARARPRGHVGAVLPRGARAGGRGEREAGRPVRPDPQLRHGRRRPRAAPGAQRVAEPAHAHRAGGERERRRHGAAHRDELRRRVRVGAPPARTRRALRADLAELPR